MLDKAGVKYEVKADPDPTMCLKVIIKAEHGSHPTNPGYMGFCTEFRFDKNGALINVGCWE
jgi:hypothetical protein